MNITELKAIYENLLQPVFGKQLHIDDSEETQNWIAITLDKNRNDFYLSLYGTNCVYLYWCSECFIFAGHRKELVSSDTFGEIVYEGDFDAERLPYLILSLILQLKDCEFISKSETIKGKTPSGYDDIKEYTILAKPENRKRSAYQLSNITIVYVI
ncbi:hypothetical protein AALC17_03585 [Oscillospiraceae bacterium 38-13]